MNFEYEVPLESTEQTLLALGRTDEAFGTESRARSNSELLTRILRAQWMAYIAHTEVHTDNLLELLFSSAMESAPPGYLALLESARKTSFGTWDARKTAFGKVFAIRLSDFTTWQRVDAAIWVRNSFAHGDGNVTRMQKRSEASKAELLGVAVLDGQLRVDRRSLSNCGAACAEFVRDLDAEVRRELTALAPTMETTL